MVSGEQGQLGVTADYLNTRFCQNAWGRKWIWTLLWSAETSFIKERAGLHHLTSDLPNIIDMFPFWGGQKIHPGATDPWAYTTPELPSVLLLWDISGWERNALSVKAYERIRFLNWVIYTVCGSASVNSFYFQSPTEGFRGEELIVCTTKLSKTHLIRRRLETI